MRSRLRFATMACAASLAATVAPAWAGPPRSSAARTGYDRLMAAIERHFARRTGDEAALRTLYTADAIFVGADGNTVHGRDEIARGFRQVLSSRVVSGFRVTTTRFRATGDLSYGGGYQDFDERGADGRVRKARQLFLVVLRRQPAGDWRFDYIMEMETRT